jgi:hypothetical protein
MLESILLIANLAVTGTPGDTLVCRKMLGDEVLASVMLVLGPHDHAGNVAFYLLPDEAGKVTFDCKILQRS